MTVAVAGTSGPQAQIWYTVNKQIRTTIVERELAKRRIVVAEFPGLVRNATNVERWMLFPRTTGTPAMRGKKVAYIVLTMNTTLSTRKVPSHVRLQRLAYNEKEKRCRLMGVAVTSRMILPALKEDTLMTGRRIDSAIINITGNQKCHRLRMHCVDLERDRRQTEVIELLQVEIEAGTDNIKLSWTPRLLHSPVTMETLLANPEKKTVSFMIIVTSVEDRDGIIKGWIRFGG